MAGIACPRCGKVTKVPGIQTGRHLAGKTGVPYLGEVPLDPLITESCNRGGPFVLAHPQSAATLAFEHILDQVQTTIETSPVMTTYT